MNSRGQASLRAANQEEGAVARPGYIEAIIYGLLLSPRGMARACLGNAATSA
jgi:hypothetical protein